MRRLLLLASASTLMCCAALLPAVAGAATYIPPGYAGASQYVEDLPTAGGNVAPPVSGSGTGGKTLQAVGAGARGARKLERLGSLGQQAAAFAKATAPTMAGHAPSSSMRNGGGSGPIAGVSGSVSGGLASFIAGQDHGGLGVLLPVLLGLGLVGALSYALLARRRPPAAGGGGAPPSA